MDTFEYLANICENKEQLYNIMPIMSGDMRVAAIGILLACEDDNEGPRPVIISGGEVLELGPQEGGKEIPF